MPKSKKGQIANLAAALENARDLSRGVPPLLVRKMVLAYFPLEEKK